MEVKYSDFIKFNKAPDDADHIGVYDKNGKKIINVNLGDFKPKLGKKLYSFGLLSDVHNKKAPIINDDQDFRNALSFFNGTTDIKPDVKFTCICGDITENGSEKELTYYNTNISLSNIPVYTTTGNHDCPKSGDFNETMWKKYTGCDKLMMFNSNNIVENTDDIFIFFGMNNYNLGDTGNPYLTEDINWLEKTLKDNENKRVFIFTHLFFPDKAGNFNKLYPSGNWLGGKQLERLNRLSELYLNAIWFSGHSHWMWYLQSLPDTVNKTENSDRANIYRSFNDNNVPTCGWTVHVPSCAKPIDSTGSNRDDGNESDACSEGAIVDVYDNYIILKGISFKDKSDTIYKTKYIPLAYYKLDTDLIELNVTESTEPVKPESFITNYINASDCTINTSKNTDCKVTQGEGDYVIFEFKKASQGFYIKPERYTTDLSCCVIIEDFVYDTPTPNNWSDSMKSKVGFYNGSGYVYTNGSIVKTYENGIQFNVSSSYPGELPIKIKVKFKLNFY